MALRQLGSEITILEGDSQLIFREDADIDRAVVGRWPHSQLLIVRIQTHNGSICQSIESLNNQPGPWGHPGKRAAIRILSRI